MTTSSCATTPRAIRNCAKAHRRIGYAEKIYLDIGQGNVSFGPGGWNCVLELYVPGAGPTEEPVVSITHVVAADPTLALMILPKAQLRDLFLEEYSRLVIATSPTGQQYLLVDGKLTFAR